MKPWTVIVSGATFGSGYSHVRETSLPHDKEKAWAIATERYGELNLIAIIPGSFKNLVFNGFSETNR